MITLLTAAALASAPAIVPPSTPAPASAAQKAPPCDMPCCKDGPAPCCEKMHAEKKAEAPAESGHGAHEHDH